MFFFNILFYRWFPRATHTMPGHASAGSSSPLSMHDADAIASLVMLHHAARTRSSVVMEANCIVSLGDIPRMDGGHALSARRGLSPVSSGMGLVGSTTSVQDVTAGVLSCPRFRRRRLSEVHEEYSDGGHDFSDDNLYHESSVEGCFQHLVPGNGASCVLERDHPAGLCFHLQVQTLQVCLSKTSTREQALTVNPTTDLSFLKEAEKWLAFVMSNDARLGEKCFWGLQYLPHIELWQCVTRKDVYNSSWLDNKTFHPYVQKHDNSTGSARPDKVVSEDMYSRTSFVNKSSKQGGGRD